MMIGWTNSLNNKSKIDSEMMLLNQVLNIKYIVVLREIKQTKIPTIHYYIQVPGYIVGDPEKFILFFSQSSVLEKVKESEKYIIYEINP